jgi:hypothetical protein
MTPLGLNLPGDPRYTVDEIAATGAKLVRLPLRFEFDLTHFLRGCQQRGIKTMLVGDSHPDSLGPDEMLWDTNISRADLRYGGMVDYWQWGNEPEADAASDSSFHMGQEALNRLNAIAKRLQPTRYHVLAGLCSGQPTWLDGVDLSLVDAIAFHPYAKAPWSLELAVMIAGYYAYGKPMCVTEYDSRTPEMSICMEADPGLSFALAFAYHDDVTGFGLVDQQGNKRPSYFEFQQAAGALDSGVPDTGGVTVPAFHLGFADKVAELGADVVGAPLEDETYITPNYSLQMTEKGLLVYSKEANKVHFLAAQ